MIFRQFVRQKTLESMSWSCNIKRNNNFRIWIFGEYIRFILHTCSSPLLMSKQIRDTEKETAEQHQNHGLITDGTVPMIMEPQLPCLNIG